MLGLLLHLGRSLRRRVPLPHARRTTGTGSGRTSCSGRTTNTGRTTCAWRAACAGRRSRARTPRCATRSIGGVKPEPSLEIGKIRLVTAISMRGQSNTSSAFQAELLTISLRTLNQAGANASQPSRPNHHASKPARDMWRARARCSLSGLKKEEGLDTESLSRVQANAAERGTSSEEGQGGDVTACNQCPLSP